jgi:hypothetical protein
MDAAEMQKIANDLAPEYQTSSFHFAGFSFDKMFGAPDGNGWLVYIPLYFPALFSTLLLLFAWRKTRAKPIGRTFPIEPTAKASEPPT